jgi:hypothetical protein
MELLSSLIVSGGTSVVTFRWIPLIIRMAAHSGDEILYHRATVNESGIDLIEFFRRRLNNEELSS